MNRNNIKINFIYNLLYQLLLIILPLITIPYLSRVLGINKIGKYAYTFSITHYFVLFAMLGVNNYGNRSIASVSYDKEKLEKTFWSIYLMQFIISVFVTIIYSVYMINIQNKIGLILILYMISSILDINWFFFGLEKFKLTVMRNTIIKTLATIAVFIFVKKPEDIYIYSFIIAISFFLSQLILWLFLRKLIKFRRIKIKEILVHIKPNLILFIPIIAISLYKIMDKIMLGSMTNTSYVGFYESAEKVINVPIALSISLGTVMLPRMSKLLTENKRQEVLFYIEKSIVFSIFFSSIICFGIMGISDNFVPIFYGKGYKKCIILFKILLPSCIFMSFANVIRTQYLLPEKKDKIFTCSIILGAIVNLIVNFLLIPKYNSTGTAIGTLLAEMTVCFYQAFYVRKSLPIKKYLFHLVPYIIAGIIMYIVLQTNIFLFKGTLYKLLLQILTGFIIYSLVILIFLLISLKTRFEFIKKEWLMQIFKWKSKVN